ncbi:LacI family DNA-binding transcriptional regulator [Fundicoccus culcitae]|uniref:LacI family transcriptional regulator n=1 Tax=Fundicoccus culcitae TaxID=2969821 RepID=A0ABY5P426_9LACT|nr:LacI family DNA-binding transcriptional regulator [Fundicoccus culcitae]UUX33355.1 LacI family transcriptional regulator [Fundicoccus culcitae]
MATINDVAKLAGVSKSTVSHVFNNTKFTSDGVKRRVLAAAKELNYKSNYYAKTLATNQSQVIGIQLDSPTGSLDMFQQKVINSILKICTEKEYYLLLMPNFSERHDYFPIDGLILMNPKIQDTQAVETPHIWLGRPSQAIIDTSYYVDNDNQAMMKQLTQLLLTKVKTGILFINAADDMTVSQDREKGFREALTDDTNYYHINYNRQISQAAFAYEVLNNMWPTHNLDTIIVDNDVMAQGVYKFATENQLNIPADLAVIAISESLEASEFFSPTLSCVDLKEAQLGETIATNLIHLINDVKIPKQATITTDIKIKDSLR